MKEGFLCKAKSIKYKDGILKDRWVVGWYATNVIGNPIIITIEDFSKLEDIPVNEWQHIELIDVDTVCRCTGVKDLNYDDIYENDKIHFLGMEGKVVYECGAFGIAFDNIDYDLIQSAMDKEPNCCGNKYEGCFNDNFISLWEIYWNFNCCEDGIDVIEKTGNIHDK